MITAKHRVEPKLYTLKDSSIYLSIPVSMLRRMVLEGEIPHVRRQTRNGRVIYLDRSDLDRWIENNKNVNSF